MAGIATLFDANWLSSIFPSVQFFNPGQAITDACDQAPAPFGPLVITSLVPLQVLNLGPVLQQAVCGCTPTPTPTAPEHLYLVTNLLPLQLVDIGPVLQQAQQMATALDLLATAVPDVLPQLLGLNSFPDYGAAGP